MRTLAVLLLILTTVPSEGAEPRLTKDLGEKVRQGIGKLTEQELLKVMSGPVKIRPGREGVDWVLSWDEVTSFEVVLIDGKVTSLSAEFNDTVVSKTLTVNGLKRIKSATTKAEVEKVLGSPNRTSSLTDDMGVSRTTCRWGEGRRVFAQIKDGKVIGGGFMEGQLPP